MTFYTIDNMPNKYECIADAVKHAYAYSKKAGSSPVGIYQNRNDPDTGKTKQIKLNSVRAPQIDPETHVASYPTEEN